MRFGQVHVVFVYTELARGGQCRGQCIRIIYRIVYVVIRMFDRGGTRKEFICICIITSALRRFLFHQSMKRVYRSRKKVTSFCIIMFRSSCLLLGIIGSIVQTSIRRWSFRLYLFRVMIIRYIVCRELSFMLTQFRVHINTRYN